MSHLRWAALLCVLALWTVSPRLSQAEDYPNRPIHIAVGFAPGGVADTVARLYAKELTVRLGQTVIVDNMPGVYNLKATDLVFRSPPDGYNLLLSSSDQLMLPFQKKNYRYDFNRDFTPLSTLASSWTVFAVNSALPVKTLKDFVGYAKASDGTTRYGSGGIATPMHIAVELLEMQSQIKLVHVPYPSGAASLTDLLGGRIEAGSMGLASAKSMEGGNIRVLTQAGSQRHPLFPDVPTIAESGYPDASLEYWFGLSGPKGLPDNVVQRLDAALRDVISDPAFQKSLVQVGMAAEFRSSGEFRKYIDQETTRWAKIIPEIGLPELD